MTPLVIPEEIGFHMSENGPRFSLTVIIFTNTKERTGRVRRIPKVAERKRFRGGGSDYTSYPNLGGLRSS